MIAGPYVSQLVTNPVTRLVTFDNSILAVRPYLDGTALALSGVHVVAVRGERACVRACVHVMRAVRARTGSRGCVLAVLACMPCVQCACVRACVRAVCVRASVRACML